MLSQAAVDAKGEEYARRLAAIAMQLATLAEQEQDLDPAEDHNMTADDCDEPVNAPAGER